MAHTHMVSDRNARFVINSVTRSIITPKASTKVLMQNDHNSEIFSFEMDRTIEGHDMSECNKVEIHYTNRDTTSRSASEGVYEVLDFKVSETDDTKVTFSWLVSGNVTKYAGPLAFLVLFACTDGEEITYRWYTGINDDFSITTGMNHEAIVVEACPDILGQWRSLLINSNYPYEAAKALGFEGTEEEWYEHMINDEKFNVLYKKYDDLYSELNDSKQDNLEVVTEGELNNMFDGTYVVE